MLNFRSNGHRRVLPASALSNLGTLGVSLSDSILHSLAGPRAYLSKSTCCFLQLDSVLGFCLPVFFPRQDLKSDAHQSQSSIPLHSRKQLLPLLLPSLVYLCCPLLSMQVYFQTQVSLGEPFSGAQTGRHTHCLFGSCSRHPRSPLPGGASARQSSLQMEGLRFSGQRTWDGYSPGWCHLGPIMCPVMTSPLQPGRAGAEVTQ